VPFPFMRRPFLGPLVVSGSSRVIRFLILATSQTHLLGEHVFQDTVADSSWHVFSQPSETLFAALALPNQ